jgi:hypothetical protein
LLITIRGVGASVDLRSAKAAAEFDPRRAPARMLTWVCRDGYRLFVIAALHAGRGYVLLTASPTAAPRASDLRDSNSVRASFRFPKS